MAYLLRAAASVAQVATLLVQALGTAIFGVQVTALSSLTGDGGAKYGYYMSLGIALFFYIAFVLDGYLPMVEPHLDVLIERFDDIEPHLEFCLEHADVVVPHLNEIVEYLDDILFFAQERELWLRLEPLLPQLVKRLPLLGPHLPNLRRHSERVTPFLPLLAPHCDRLVHFEPISQHADGAAGSLVG
eukprot:Skav207452  [mRNA]  locus=scaffold3545:50760:57028:+ [translate_table: standard]